jgi:ubiquitin-conjugating enzyme E2 S
MFLFLLQTISCLLINPNPDSALNAAAGQLLQEDYEAFARQAKLMASIHAPVPKDLKDAVLEAKRRGEDPEMLDRGDILEDNRTTPVTTGKASSSGTASGVVIKRNRSHRLNNLQGPKARQIQEPIHQDQNC